MVEARRHSGLAVDTLVAIAKDGQTDSSRLNAAVELLNRGYSRPAQSLDLHLSADAITKRHDRRWTRRPRGADDHNTRYARVEHVDEPQVNGGTDGSHIDAARDDDGCADDAGELADGRMDAEAAGDNT
jgi:hypothetical protein